MSEPSDQPLLTVEGLSVGFPGGIEAVRGVDLTVRRGECLAVVGESGSGKSVTARAVLGLTGRDSTVRADRIELDGMDLSGLDSAGWRAVRGRRIGLVTQDALSALDPLRTVAAEVIEPLRNHRVVPRDQYRRRALELLAQAHLPEPERRAAQHPFQLSGGQRQRVLIASAMAAEPALLIADEPTTALDVTVQAQILDLLAEKVAAGTSLLLISHDLSVVARLADEVAVMYQGRIVERGPVATVLFEPGHPYTRALLAAVPTSRKRGERLSPGPGPRTGTDEPAVRRAAPAAGPDHAPVLEVDRVSKSYGGRPAVVDVSLTLNSGEVLGVVGESGSGKTTLAEMVIGLRRPDRGTVRLRGAPWSELSEPGRRARRREIQLVQQDPLAAFDPRYTVERIIAEALGLRSARRVRPRIREILGLVGLSADLIQRRPRQLSGGQRQRVAIARALATEPSVLVCDEPVSALDVSVQAQILDLLAGLRDELGLALLFISHDLGVIQHVSDRVLVMHAARVVESGDIDAVFQDPQDPYTRGLLAAIPRIADARAVARPAVDNRGGSPYHR